jgi:hypothetical protein
VRQVEGRPHRPLWPVVQRPQPATLVSQLPHELLKAPSGLVGQQRGHDLHRQRQPPAQLDQPSRGARIRSHPTIAEPAGLHPQRQQLHRLLRWQHVQVDQPCPWQLAECVSGGDQHAVLAGPGREQRQDLPGVGIAVSHYEDLRPHADRHHPRGQL